MCFPSTAAVEQRKTSNNTIMSDEGGAGDQDANAPQGRWLGAVRSWVGSAAPQEDEAPAASSSPALSAEEIRRRRLERMEGTKTQQVGAARVHMTDNLDECGGDTHTSPPFCRRPLGALTADAGRVPAEKVCGSPLLLLC